MQDFRDKVAVITGGASGIGWGLAERCTAEGMKVVIADIEQAALDKAEQTLKGSGAAVMAVRTDVTKLTEVEALARKTLDTFGAVHLLFNNAGVNTSASLRQPLWENPIGDWEWVIAANLWGVIYGVKVFTPIMLQQSAEGYIVNTASMAGLIAEPQLAIYAMTKAGVVSLSESLLLQLKKTNSAIGVSVLCPAFVGSRLGEAERNRPEAPKNRTAEPPRGEQPELVRQFRGGVKVLSPEESADIVFKAIRENQFYIFTDPLVRELFRQRAENILAGKNPERPKLE